MKNISRLLLSVLTLSTVLLSACSGAPSPSLGEDSNVNDSAATPVVVEDNGNSTNSTDANSNDNNGSDGNSNDSGVEVVGVVEATTDDTITINGVTYQLASFTEFKDLIAVGDQVKIHVIVNADGTFTILEIEISTGDDNSNDANSNDDNGNDDNGNDDNGNDDDGDDDNDDDDDNDNG